MKYLLITIFIIPIIVFAQTINSVSVLIVFAQTSCQTTSNPEQLPSTLEELKLMWQNLKEKGPTVFIEGTKQSFKQALVIWKKIHVKIVNWWQNYVLPKVKSWFSKEVKQRKPGLEEEFEKEKKETGGELINFKNKVFEFYQFFKQKFLNLKK